MRIAKGQCVSTLLHEAHYALGFVEDIEPDWVIRCCPVTIQSISQTILATAHTIRNLINRTIAGMNYSSKDLYGG
jgi:hypothetical protein